MSNKREEIYKQMENEEFHEETDDRKLRLEILNLSTILLL